jgi:hypothetical protein
MMNEMTGAQALAMAEDVPALQAMNASSRELPRST